MYACVHERTGIHHRLHVQTIPQSQRPILCRTHFPSAFTPSSKWERGLGFILKAYACPTKNLSQVASAPPPPPSPLPLGTLQNYTTVVKNNEHKCLDIRLLKVVHYIIMINVFVSSVHIGKVSCNTYISAHGTGQAGTRSVETGKAR